VGSFTGASVLQTVSRLQVISLRRLRIASLSLLFSLGISLALFGEPIFQVNDSPFMKGVVSGEVTGEPITQLYFSSRALAFLLAILYSFPVSIQWYSWLQLLTLLSASSLILVQMRERSLLVSWTFFLTPVIVLGALRPDYTFTALVGTALGVTAFLIALKMNTSSSSRFVLALSLLVTLFASMWRPNASMLALAILLPGWLGVLSCTRWRALSAFPFVAVFLSFLIQEVFRRTQSGAWRDWVIYNRIRGELHGPRLELAELFADSAGWSLAAVRVFRSFATVDEPAFSLGALVRLDDALPLASQSRAADLLGIVWEGASLLSGLSGYLILAFALFVGAALLSRTCCSWKQVPILLVFGYWFLLVLVLATLRLPMNLLLPIIVGTGVTLGLIVTVGEKVGARGPQRVAAGSALIILGGLVCLFSLAIGDRGVPTMLMESKSLRQLQTNAISDLGRLDICSAYVAAPAATAGLTLLDPYGRNLMYELPFISLGWSVNSPAWHDRADRVLAGQSVLESLRVRRNEYFKPSVCLLATENTADDYASLMSDAGYGLFQPVSESGILESERGVNAWRFLEVRPPGSGFKN
jgi:hypothetical protein